MLTSHHFVYLPLFSTPPISLFFSTPPYHSINARDSLTSKNIYTLSLSLSPNKKKLSTSHSNRIRNSRRNRHRRRNRRPNHSTGHHRRRRQNLRDRRGYHDRRARRLTPIRQYRGSIGVYGRGDAVDGACYVYCDGSVVGSHGGCRGLTLVNAGDACDCDCWRGGGRDGRPWGSGG